MNQPLQKPTVEERITDAVFKLITAGSGGYALYNIATDDLPKAAIAGLVSLGSALVTSFGQGLMARLSKSMKKRGEASGKLMDEAFDTTLDKTLTRLTGFHRQYLDALKTHCHNLKVEGYKGRLPRLALEEVYVPLRVNPGRHAKTSLPHHSLKIWDVLPKQHHPQGTFPERLLAVIADPGYGKTTLMRFLTLSFSNQTYADQGAKELIPILLLFRDMYSRIQSATQPSLPQLIVEQVQQLPRCSDLRTSEPWFKEQLSQGKCLVMLDGLDEVPEAQRELASKWAHWQMQNYPTQFILTSRPHGFDNSLFEGVQRIDILDFNNDQKRTFINQWYKFITWELTWKHHWQESQHHPDPKRHLSRDQVKAESNAEAQTAADDLSLQLFADQNLVDLAKNPLLITIIAATHEASEQLPRKRVYLYREIFKLLLEYRPNRRDTHLTITNAEDNQSTLQCLALRLTEAEKTQFSTAEGVSWITDRLAEVHPEGKVTPKGFLREIQQVSGLLAGGESNLYEFTHKTFQEYLAAVELNEQRQGKTVTEQFENPNWKETICFYAALTDPVPFIKLALKNPNEYTLGLAQRLKEESNRVSEDLYQELLEAQQKLAPESTEVNLIQRFRHLIPISDTAAMTEAGITWGEYQLFLNDQTEQQFHSWAEESRITTEQKNKPVSGVKWEDAQWFCAWLSTQSNLAPDDGVYDYRLPTKEELEKVEPQDFAPSQNRDSTRQPYMADTKQAINSLLIVRHRIPDRYRELVNYLANGRWKEADSETYGLMLTVVGEEAVKRRYLEVDEINNFPCDDLQIIDCLWIKFSGGKFGFSIQKEIYLECGGIPDGKYYEDAYNKFRNAVVWSSIKYDITSPKGHLPVICHHAVREDVGGVSLVVEEREEHLFSRIQTCKV